MYRFNHLKQVGVSVLIGGVLLTSCAQSVTPSSAPAETSQVFGAADSNDDASSTLASTTQALPQLARRAEINLIVKSLEEGLKQVNEIARTQQGDLLNLQHQLPEQPGQRQTAYLQIRVPQARLEETLNQLAELGTVQRRLMTAEDVSNQLVDFQAQLRNLRKTEAMLLEIMERSGSVADVLEVAQEASEVRSSIERIDAQLKNLQNRVNYSTIDVNLEAAIAVAPPRRAVGEQTRHTWRQATRSVQGFTVGLLKLGLWLVAYSPYWLALATALFFGVRWKNRNEGSAAEETTPET